MDIKDLSAFVRKISLFSIYSDDELTELMQRAELKSVKAGELLFDQGDRGDSFYIVYSGKIRILQRNEEGKEINLGVRTSGDHFGETALITDNPRNALARASSESVLVTINRDAFNEYLFSRPDLREYFDKFIKSTSIHTFLKSCTDLSVIKPKELQNLIHAFQSEFFEEGQAVFRQGKEPDKFYLLESGKIKVVRWENNQSEIINVLREGDFFGEKALIEESVRHADIICLTDCHVFSLSKESFNDLILKSPKLKAVVADRIESYATDQPPIPYQDIIKQELAAHKGIKVEKDVDEDELAATEEKKKYFAGLSSAYYRKVRFPFIKQYDEMTCGTTCIMMIAKYFGKTFSSARVRELAHVDLSGSSLSNLAVAAEQLGFTTRALRLSYETLRAAPLPAIIHWQGFHYVLVYKINATHIWVADPAMGLRKYTKEHFCKNWDGITLTCEPTPEFETQEEDSSAIKNFFQFIVPYKMILFEVFLASLLLNLFGLATPIFTQNIIDKVLTHGNVSMLNIMMVGMLLVLVFRILTVILRQYLIIHTGMKIDLRMLVYFYKHMLALPLGYFKVRKIGDFITRFGENMKIRNFMTNTALTLVLDSILIVVYLVLMLYYNVAMTGLVMLFIPLLVLVTLLFTPILKRLNVDSFKARAETQSHLIESINAVDTVKAMNIEFPIRWRWEDKFVKNLNIDFKLYNTAMYFHSFGDFISTLSSTIILWYGAHQVMAGTLSIGELMAFMALLGSVITPINRIVMAWDEVQQTLVSIDRLNDVFAAKAEFPEGADAATGITLREPKGAIVFDDVFFRYGGDDDPYIISKVKLKIAAGQTMALVGRSGSGKTTLVKLLARFYDVTEGKITIDGCDLKSIDLGCLRKMVGFVLQENFIFDATIRENIAMHDPEATMEKVMEAAKLANAHDFITNLAMGYETKTGESGLQLSGGQKQRIAIARVLYSRPKILVFDEATSSLDTESEQAIQKNLDMILKDRTAIVIAHRLSTVRSADTIVVLDNGEVVEQGDHDELMAKKGLYHYLNHQQLNL